MRPDPLRLLLGALGVGGIAWGAWLLLDEQDLDALLRVALWLAGGVVLHDAVLAPLVVVLGAGATRVPRAVRGVGARVLVVLGSVTLLAIPVLLSRGESYDAANRTILDRPYGQGWLLVAVLVVLGAVLAEVVGRRRALAAGQPDAGVGPEPAS